MAGENDKNIAQYKARPADVASLQPLFKAKVDEPGVKPDEVEDEEGGNVAMKEGGTRPERSMIFYYCQGTSADDAGWQIAQGEFDD